MLLFVFGTMKKGHKHHFFLKGAKLQGEVETEPRYLLYEGDYVFLVCSKQGRCIQGELYDVSQDIIDKIDQASKGKFHKEKIKVKGKEEVFAYVYKESVIQYLDCGTSWPRL